ncbi:hypothetical protein MBLNU457_3421t1 [Dothideomycetes sp. NU457]
MRSGSTFADITDPEGELDVAKLYWSFLEPETAKITEEDGPTDFEMLDAQYSLRLAKAGPGSPNGDDGDHSETICPNCDDSTRMQPFRRRPSRDRGIATLGHVAAELEAARTRWPQLFTQPPDGEHLTTALRVARQAVADARRTNVDQVQGSGESTASAHQAAQAAQNGSQANGGAPTATHEDSGTKRTGVYDNSGAKATRIYKNLGTKDTGA